MSVIKHPIGTEKAIRMMEAENKLIFMVDEKANKVEIKQAVEELLGAKVVSVNTLKSFKGKKAFVTFAADTPAIDQATKLGLM